MLFRTKVKENEIRTSWEARQRTISTSRCVKKRFNLTNQKSNSAEERSSSYLLYSNASTDLTQRAARITLKNPSFLALVRWVIVSPLCLPASADPFFGTAMHDFFFHAWLFVSTPPVSWETCITQCVWRTKLGRGGKPDGPPTVLGILTLTVSVVLFSFNPKLPTDSKLPFFPSPNSHCLTWDGKVIAGHRDGSSISLLDYHNFLGQQSFVSFPPSHLFDDLSAVAIQ